MDVTLTWDLFIIVFFAIVIAYTFIIGRHESVKIIVCTYIAIVAVQGLGNIMERFTGESQQILNILGVTVDFTLLSTSKLLLFVAAIILLSIRGGIEVEYSKEPGTLLSVIITGLFGFATAGLLLTTLLTYVAGVPLLDANIAEAAAVSPILKQSTLMQAMVLNQDLWFSLPALLLVGVGFISSGGE